MLSVFRFISAAYETGDVACSEAAHARAEAAHGVLEGALLVARATAVLRLLRTARPTFVILPPSSRWLSDDEAALMRFVRQTRPESPVPDALPLIDAGSTAPLAAAARGLLTGATLPAGCRGALALASAA